MTGPEREGAAGGEQHVETSAGAEATDGIDALDPADVKDAMGGEAAVAEDGADAPDGVGGEAEEDETRVVEAPDEEELVAAPAWATLILVLAPFVVGLLVILALRWLL